MSTAKEVADEIAKLHKTPSGCVGETCNTLPPPQHSPECLFKHFMAYSGGFKQPVDVQALLKKAYMDGMETSPSANTQNAARYVWYRRRQMMQYPTAYKDEADFDARTDFAMKDHP